MSDEYLDCDSCNSKGCANRRVKLSCKDESVELNLCAICHVFCKRDKHSEVYCLWVKHSPYTEVKMEDL